MEPHRAATTVNVLPEDVLLEIFDLFRIVDEATTTINFVPFPGSVLLDLFDLFRDEATLDTTSPTHLPWKWHRLAHVCRTWRDIIFASSRRLNLELLCTYGTPVRKNLRHLPPLPIVIHFPDFSKDSDEDNILAALEHPDRVRSVRLYVSCSLLEKMAAVMQGPFPALTYLWLKSREDGHMPALPDSFLGGCAPRLQKIYLDGIPFPTVPTLLLSACDLIDVHLNFRNIPNTSYISLEVMVASLATLPRLKRLTLGSQWEGSWPDQRPQSPITRTVLPALTTFFFDSLVEYLEDFVTQIDTPQLNHLAIQYLEDVLDFDSPIPQLCKFIDRSEKLKLSQFRRVDLDFRPSSFVIDLDEGRSSLRFRIQYDGITGLLSQICGMLSYVDCLVISAHGDYVVDDEDIEWLEILRLFTTVKALGARNHASLCVALELGTLLGEETAGVLPALELLYLENQPAIYVEEFLTARRNVGLPVTLIGEASEFREILELQPDSIGK
ncbi:hypothetical protein EDB89DRAFT_180083 [Lactarius sanguifluus]|nr:hypothetical protein EDB89DRAFT_180083 [Lactarius sanguifluus]